MQIRAGIMAESPPSRAMMHSHSSHMSFDVFELSPPASDSILAGDVCSYVHHIRVSVNPYAHTNLCHAPTTPKGMQCLQLFCEESCAMYVVGTLPEQSSARDVSVMSPTDSEVSLHVVRLAREMISERGISFPSVAHGGIESC